MRKVTLIETSIRTIGTNGTPANKKAIKVLGVNNTSAALTGSTVLKSGQAEVKEFVIPVGFAFAIGADGEYYVLAGEKNGTQVSTFAKLYEQKPMIADEAVKVAKAAGLKLTPWEMVEKVREDLATRNPGVDLSGITFGYFRATGKGEVFRQPNSSGSAGNKIAKPSWGGDGWQQNGGDAVLLISESSCHCIGKEEFLRDWILTERPELSGDALYEGITQLTEEQFLAMQS